MLIPTTNLPSRAVECGSVAHENVMIDHDTINLNGIGFGLTWDGVLSGVVFFDSNRNGVFDDDDDDDDDDEVSLGGMVVTLTGTTSSGEFFVAVVETVELLPSSEQQQQQQQQQVQYGYSIANIPPGNYAVAVTCQQGQSQTLPSETTVDMCGSSMYRSMIIDHNTAILVNVDFGLYQTGIVAGLVFFDAALMGEMVANNKNLD